jgi:SAM-dependent methyltransferase
MISPPKLRNPEKLASQRSAVSLSEGPKGRESHQQLAIPGVDNLSSSDFRSFQFPLSKESFVNRISKARIMRGFVPTPAEIVDHMVDRLFRGRAPTVDDNLLDPGCGSGVFLAGVLRWCAKHGLPTPKMVGVESDLRRAQTARANFELAEEVQIRRADFLTGSDEHFDFVIGNPPYVAIYGFSDDEKQDLRAKYKTARGRFDLYLLFFERALRSLKSGGRMVFITPEKFLYVETAGPLRRLLGSMDVEEIELLNEKSFAGLVTYPTITTVVNRPPRKRTTIRLRDGTHRRCGLADAPSWMPTIQGVNSETSNLKLKEICIRISCGVATGADDVFVRELDALEPELAKFARPTIAGRELSVSTNIAAPRPYVMLLPYNHEGKLLREADLGLLGSYLLQQRRRLELRTCTRLKPWYAFHETPPLVGMLRPKILCKDITEKPRFWIDNDGSLVPRHSVYYIVPADVGLIESLCSYLNSPSVTEWLTQYCQRASNGFLRLQANVLKQMPIPSELASGHRRLRRDLQPELSLLGKPETVSAR